MINEAEVYFLLVNYYKTFILLEVPYYLKPSASLLLIYVGIHRIIPPFVWRPLSYKTLNKSALTLPIKFSGCCFSLHGLRSSCPESDRNGALYTTFKTLFFAKISNQGD